MITFVETDTSTGTVSVVGGAYTFYDRREIVNFVWDIIKDFTHIKYGHYKNQPPGTILVQVHYKGMEGETEVSHIFSHILRLTNNKAIYESLNSFYERCQRNESITPAEGELLIRLRDNLRLYV